MQRETETKDFPQSAWGPQQEVAELAFEPRSHHSPKQHLRSWALPGHGRRGQSRGALARCWWWHLVLFSGPAVTLTQHHSQELSSFGGRAMSIVVTELYSRKGRGQQGAELPVLSALCRKPLWTLGPWNCAVLSLHNLPGPPWLRAVLECSILGVERPHSSLCQWQHLSLRNTRGSLQMTIWLFF